MTKPDRSTLWSELKDAGWEPENGRTYSTYKLLELQQIKQDIIDRAVAAGLMPAETHYIPEPEPAPAPVQSHFNNALAGEFSSRIAENEPIRTDPDGRVWYQDEVRKQGHATPRARRVIRYQDPGVRTEEVKLADGTFESFEVGGNRTKTNEARVTMPTYQVGIYQDPGHPFRTHEYAGVRGFNLFDVENFYGGPEQVPKGIKRIYVYTDMCYDMRTTVQAMTDQAAQLMKENQ